MTATIKDVARLAGCSIKTVSRVINGEPYVTEETRARVQAAIRAVGYAPNISARRLAQNKSFMICILMYPGFSQPASEMLSRIMDIGYEENYDILIQTYFPSHARSRRKLVSLIYEHRIDGFVITPPIDADEFVADMLSTYKVPQVQVNPVHPSPEVPFISGDDQRGALTMTEYLIALGHRRIAFLKGPRNLRAGMDRFSGYQEALDHAGIPYNEALVRDSEWTFDGGYTQTHALMDLPQPPTAIFAGNDETALGVTFAAQELRLDIPGQLSIAGYDDIVLSRNVWPGLTTIHQPAEDLLDQATRQLIRMLVDGTPAGEHTVMIPSTLVVRGSTGRAPKVRSA